VLSKDLSVLEALSGAEGVARLDPGWVGRLWRAVRERGRVGILVEPGAELAEVCRRIALRLGLAKLVWIDPAGPLRRPDGERISLVDVAGLDELLAAGSATSGHRQLLAEIRSMVTQGLPAVNLCSFDGLADDLFTFEGSGTFFAREHYLDVRRLSLDEFDAAHDLVQRGVAEGYLVDRSPEQLDDVLANAFGVFIEDRYLAGVGALLPPGLRADGDRGSGSAAPAPEDAAGEICSLYTLTRFLGEGVGGHLVDFAMERAAELRLEYVFACTTSDRVRAFFERQGFRTVSPAEIPAQKWRDYPPERRARVRCLRRDCG
jgi:amino-acid N-acetyltransferase